MFINDYDLIKFKNKCIDLNIFYLDSELEDVRFYVCVEYCPYIQNGQSVKEIKYFLKMYEKSIVPIDQENINYFLTISTDLLIRYLKYADINFTIEHKKGFYRIKYNKKNFPMTIDREPSLESLMTDFIIYLFDNEIIELKSYNSNIL